MRTAGNVLTSQETPVFEVIKSRLRADHLDLR